MSASDNGAPSTTMDMEVAVATSMETSPVGGFSSREHTQNFEGSPTHTNGESSSNAGEVNDNSGTDDQVVEPPLSSPGSSAEDMSLTTGHQVESCDGENSSGTGEGSAVIDKEQSYPAQGTTSSDLDTQPLNETPIPSSVPESDKRQEAVPIDIHSVPPHLRPGFQARVSRYSELTHPRAPPRSRAIRGNGLPQGSSFNSPQYGPRHDNILPAEIVRLNAQILKIQSDLDAERTKNRNLRRQVESEQRHNYEVAFADMLTNLLHEQTAALALKASVKATQRDIVFRESSAIVTGQLLAEGQKCLAHKLAKHGEGLMSEAERVHMRRLMKLEIGKEFADQEAELAYKSKELRLRADAQQKREEQYKILIREELEEEISAKKAKEEYQRGVADGKELGKKEAMKEVGKNDFLKGYLACYRAQAALSAFRKGELARDSPELDFLFDPAHPGNMLSMGLKIGQLELPDTVEANTPTPKAKSKAKSQSMDVDDSGIEDDTYDSFDQSNDVPAPFLRIRSASPPKYTRPTLAAELRGPSPLYNGQVVLANGDAYREPATQPTRVPTVQNNAGEANLIDLS